MLESFNELEQLAGTISLGMKKTKNKDALKLINQHSPIDIAYISAIYLQQGIGGYKPATSIFGQIGRELCRNQEVKVKNLTKFYIFVGYTVIRPVFDTYLLKIHTNNDDQKLIQVEKKHVDFFENLFKFVNENPRDIQLSCRPSFKKPEPYTKFEHKHGQDLVKNCNPSVLTWFKPAICPLVFETVNTHMEVSYIINNDVLDVYNAIEHDDEIFLKTKKDLTSQQREGIEREQKSTLQIARGTRGKRFWQFMNYDFRGRLYSNAVYLSTQGSKLSKSLIQFAEKERIGIRGWWWMLIHATNCWGKDKLPLTERARYAKDRLDEWMLWASDPVADRGWTKADDPYGFLAIIIDIYKAINHDNPYDYKSGAMIALDATCSGLQILSLLGRDELSGKLCNVTDDEEIGDFYSFIKDKVWEKFPKEVSKEQLEALDKLIEELEPYQKRVDNILNKIRDEEDKQKKFFLRQSLDKAITSRYFFYKNNEKRFEECAPTFWKLDRVEKNGRKLCKRPGMTYFYSCMEWTMAKTLFSDWSAEEDLRGINPIFCQYLSKRIYKVCVEEMDIPTRIMNLFIEMGMTEYSKGFMHMLNGEPMSKARIMKRLNIKTDEFNKLVKEDKEVKLNPDYVANGNDLCLIAPYNKFMFMQYYRKPLKERVKMYYRNKEMKLTAIVGHDEDINYKKVMSASSPNVVHMLDAQIVASVVNNTRYLVSTIHDSFSSRPGTSNALYVDIRRCAYDIFKVDVLQSLMDQIKFNKIKIKYGNLDPACILTNQYYAS